jgi:hypothetical protein
MSNHLDSTPPPLAKFVQHSFGRSQLPFQATPEDPLSLRDQLTNRAQLYPFW